jgi:hypothetical protein
MAAFAKDGGSERRDLADFHSRHGEAPLFAGKGREMAPGLRRMGRYEGRSAGRLRANRIR